jgi:hypothetical protein
VPIVPNATFTTKWIRYVWIRVPFPGEADKAPKFYAWNNNAVDDATYLKWQRVKSDTTAIEADVVVIEADVANAISIANAAATTAGIANRNAKIANEKSDTAVADATTASANATTALADAAAAQDDADAAQGTADGALAKAKAAQVTADNAASAATAVAATKFYTSAEFALVDGICINELHGFTAVPKFVRGVLVCQTDNNGYVAGDELDIAFVNNQDNDDDRNPFSLSCDDEKVCVVCDDITNNRIRSKATPSATAVLSTMVAWKVKVYAWL